MHTNDLGSVWKGTLAGALGGLAGAWMMNEAQKKGNETPRQPQGDDATMKAAEAISESVLARTLPRPERRTAGTVIHYAFGASMGALYGALAELSPSATAGAGLPFGAALWAGADEMAVPAFGFSKPPADYPASTHGAALAAHLVYGLTTEAVRRVIRAVM